MSNPNVFPENSSNNYESGDIQLLSEPDVQYLERMLGLSPDYLNNLDDIPDNEFGWLMADAFDLRDNLSDRMRNIAYATGQDISHLDELEWEPSSAQLDMLHQQSAKLRRRARMTQGMAQFANDSIELAEQQGVPLRPHQIVGVKKTADFMLNAPRNAHGGKSGAIILPTGFGKTAIFAKTVAQMKHFDDPSDPSRVLIIAPNQTLVEQAEGQGGLRGLQKFAPHLDVGTYYQYSKQLDNEVVITTIDSFIALAQAGKLPDVDGIIVDELHTMLGDTIGGQYLQEYSKDKVTIGFTATDRYNDERTVYSVVDHTIHEVPFRDAVETGKLSPIVGHLLTAEPNIDPRTLSDDPAKRSKQIRAARLMARIEKSIPIIQQAAADGLGTVVRCPAGQDIDVAVQLAEVLKQHHTEADGVNLRLLRADYVGGSQQEIDEKRAILDDFDNGGVDVLTYVKALGMGWDSTHAKVFINLASSSSGVEIRQGVGRVTRLSVVMDDDQIPRPITAHAYDFRDPTLKHQYTVLDALDSRNGELISQRQEASAEPPIPTPSYLNAVLPEIISVAGEEVGTKHVDHAVDVALPDSVEVNKAVSALVRRELSPAEVGRTLGLGQTAVYRLLRSAGFDPAKNVPKSELVALAELSVVGANVPKLPSNQSQLMSFADINAQLNTPVRMFSLIPFAREQGLTPLRYRDARGGVGYYFKAKEAARLIEMVDSGEYNLTQIQDTE